MEKKKDLTNSTSQDMFTTEKVNVIGNNLLGSYNDDNEYVIADNIKKELVACPKVKKSVFQNSVFCGAILPHYGELIFEVTFHKNTVKNAARAELYVLENEYKINGYIQNTVRTKVGEYIDDLENFIEKTYEHFHISLSEDSGREYNLKEDISLDAYIGAKNNFNQNMARLTQKDYNKLYREYVTAKLELLKKINSPYTQAILEQFNNEYAKIEKYFLKNNNYKALSELLDKCVEDTTGINPEFAKQEQEYREKMTPVIENFAKQADAIAEKAQPKAMDNLTTRDRERMQEMQRMEKSIDKLTKENDNLSKKVEATISSDSATKRAKSDAEPSKNKTAMDYFSGGSDSYGSTRDNATTKDLSGINPDKLDFAPHAEKAPTAKSKNGERSSEREIGPRNQEDEVNVFEANVESTNHRANAKENGRVKEREEYGPAQHL